MRTIALAVLSLAAAGCGPYLRYKPLPPAPNPQGKLVIEVRDNREPGRGGGDHRVVAIESGIGPFGPNVGPRKVKTPTTVAETIGEIIANGAAAAGLGVARPGEEAGATARVIVDVQRLWCAGFSPVFKADVTAGVMVTDPSGRQVRVPGLPVQAEDGAMSCQHAFEKALNHFVVAAQGLFAQPQVHGAAIGAVTFAPPPAQ